MNTYKNLEIYQLALSLSIKIYRLNIILPKHILIKQGNWIRWSSLKIKDLIIEGYNNKEKSEKDFVRYLTIAITLCNEIISQLKKINTGQYEKKSVHELIINYRGLERKIENGIKNIETSENELTLWSSYPALNDWEHRNDARITTDLAI